MGVTMKQKLAAAATALVLGVAGAGAPASAQSEARLSVSADPISARLAEVGIAAAAAELEAKGAALTSDERFALAGLRFLRAVEMSLQKRYAMNAGEVRNAPILRLPIPENPNPEPYDTAVVEEVFTDILAEMTSVTEALAPLEDATLDDGLSLAVDLGDIWFDINANGVRDGEGRRSESVISALEASGVVGRFSEERVVVNFDASDVHWLRAYAALLSGFSEIVLALDPTTALETVEPAWTHERVGAPNARGFFDPETETLFDQGVAAYLMLITKPDPERTRRAHGHFLTMIAENRKFWDRVMAETDDLAEWIPNPKQRAAVGGVTLRAEVIDAWRGVLAELEAVLQGELLIPHPRFSAPPADGGAPEGINLRRVLLEPNSFSPALWIQGSAAVPYLERGELMEGDAFSAFSSLLDGGAVGYAIWFN